MKKFEYLIVQGIEEFHVYATTIDNTRHQILLNERGAESWELVSVLAFPKIDGGTKDIIYYFKRVEE